MFLTEYNGEEAKKCMREESYEEGLAEGEKIIKDILTWLNQQNRNEDIIKAISDDAYMEKLKKEYEESQK